MYEIQDLCCTYISKVYVCRMKMETCIDCMPILRTLQRLSYKESMSTARLEIPFLSYVIELFRLMLGLCDFIRA